MTTTLNASTAGAGGFIATSDNSGVLALQTAGTTAITVDASQRVGVGVTPSAWTLPVIQLKNSAYRASGNTLGLVSNAYYDGAWKYIATDYAQDYYQQDGAHVWRYAGLGTAGNSVSWTEGMRIDNGNLLVGTTTSSATNGSDGFRVIGGGVPTVQRGVNGSFAAFYNNANSANIGSITNSGGTVTLYNTTSDQRLKENIVDAPEFGSVIDFIKVRSFDWKLGGTHQRAGFIAQELVTVAPEAVHQPIDSEEMMAVDYSKLVPMLVKEIQSLRTRFATFETKSDTQAETINALTARIVALETA